MDLSTGNIGRQVKTMNGTTVVERNEDLQPYIDIVKEKRIIANNKLSGDGFIDMCAWVLPDSIAEYLYVHGINAFAPTTEEYNFIHDWLKTNFPVLLIFPNKNMKLGGGKKARPTKEMVGMK